MARTEEAHANIDRIIQLFDELKRRNITQSYVGTCFGLPDERKLSEMRHGSRPMTRSVAERILQVVAPDIRIEWLMGYDSFMTKAEYENNKILKDKLHGSMKQYEIDRLEKFHGLNMFLSNYGYEIVDTWHYDNKGKVEIVSDLQKAFDEHYLLMKKGKPVKFLTPNGLKDLQDTLARLFDALVNDERKEGE